MLDSQRALELRKFFQPFDPSFPSAGSEDYINSLNCDGALDSYAEIVVWRLGGVRSMVSLLDRKTQYFLAGAARNTDEDGDIVSNNGSWFGCKTVDTPGGLCEWTVSVTNTNEDYPCFIVPDLSKDSRFADLPVVNGELTSFRFYAGAPITTDHGVNIGSFFMFDNKPRPNGLTLHEKKHLHNSAAHVMRHLEMTRDAAERRRAARMSKGIANFLENTSRVEFNAAKYVPTKTTRPTFRLKYSNNQIQSNTCGTLEQDDGDMDVKTAGQTESADSIDKIKLAMDNAANILWHSLELNDGGIAFFDAAVRYTPAGIMDMGNGQNRTAKVLAMACAKTAEWNSASNCFDGKTLQHLIHTYPKGYIWYFDEDGYFLSLEQVIEMFNPDTLKTFEEPGLRSTMYLAGQRDEALLLSKAFPKARQVIFLPIWDAGGDHWYSGCFVWSQSASPVFTKEVEIAYLSAFTNSLMVEISRLDAITANKMKSDFISSISHEFRSPLHGILASAEFLQDSETNALQAELISTIQNCGSTLLDTINHVLDYSKINSFERSGAKAGILSNELHRTCDIALLCEETVNGLITATEFRKGTTGAVEFSINDGTNSSSDSAKAEEYVHVILDFEFIDWNFHIQPGALQRIIMNLFGNSRKYTNSGFIIVRMQVGNQEGEGEEDSSNFQSNQVLILKIIDSGRGMSTEYMDRKLFTPFAQEDPFASGVGLGLSIVWSIVTQLGGKIHVRSEVGKGTEIEVVLPIKRENPTTKVQTTAEPAEKVSLRTLQTLQCLKSLRKIAPGKSIGILNSRISTENQRESQCREVLKMYCSTWFGFTVISSTDHNKVLEADLVIVNPWDDDWNGIDLTNLERARRVLFIRKGIPNMNEYQVLQNKNLTASVWSPAGPYKLARNILGLLNQELLPNLVENSVRTSLTDKRKDLVVDTARPESLLNRKISPVYKKVIDATYIPGVDNLELSTPPPITETANDMLQHKAMAAASQALPLHLLAVDDNPVNLHLLSRYLHKRKVDTVVTARDGAEAVAAVKVASKPFDIIFMDISMPVMNGFEATREIRKYEREKRVVAQKLLESDSERVMEENEVKHEGKDEKKGVYIIALTGLGSSRDRAEADAAGFDDFLTKPIRFAKIGDLLALRSKME